MTWYIARAGGTLAYLLLTSSVVVGLLLSNKAQGKRWPRFALEDVHRFLGLLTGVFIVIHGGALLVALGNLVADVLRAVVDPRVREAA